MVNECAFRMLTRSSLLFLLLGFMQWSCSYPLDSSGGASFSEDYENVVYSDSLFGPGKTRWTYTQQTLEGNSISIDSHIVHGGKHSLCFTAMRSGEKLSKCSISKSNMYFEHGSVIEYSAWYYLDNDLDQPYLFLVDFEETVAVGAGPGLRIALDGDGRALEVERGKMGASTIHQPEQRINFPRRQWVHLVYQIHLSQSDEGSIKLWQNGELLIDQQNIQTMPHDILYFIQGSKGVYNSIEVGITANSDKSDCVLYMDDMSIRKIE